NPVISALPERVIGSACAASFSRLARRSLALRPAHSRCHQFVTRIPKASAISSPPQLLRLLPAGAVAGWGSHPLESAALSRRTPDSDIQPRYSVGRSHTGHHCPDEDATGGDVSDGEFSGDGPSPGLRSSAQP